MYVNVSALDFLVFLAYLMIAKFGLTMIVAKFPDSPVSKALGAMVG